MTTEALSLPHPKTLFFLVPTNQIAHNALLHPDNKHRVSNSECGPGLEVGYHVPSRPGGHVITRLGRDADLILPESTPGHPMSAVHVAFEVNPTTHLVLLSVRSKRISSVTFAVLEDLNKDVKTGKNLTGEKITGERSTGDGIILYGQNYHVSIASYNFKLIWRTLSKTGNAKYPEALTLHGYKTSLQLLQDVRSRDRPTEIDNSEAQSWHITRLATRKSLIFQDIKPLRQYIGHGAFGTVYKAFDQTSGYTFAIKVVDLSSQDNVDAARALLHREIRVMQRVKHKHIIEYLGHQLFHTLYPEILMPLCSGSLTSLIKSPPTDIGYEELSIRVLGQMLSALDYLATENLIHRDVKPDNILYSRLNGCYLFQLADFGLANYHSLATRVCGTAYYQAPELWPSVSGVNASQTPKLDVWSLFACIVAAGTRLEGFPPSTGDYSVVLHALVARMPSSLEPMARLHPDRRASAAQMLVLHFKGAGLTTPKAKIPPIEPNVPAAEPSSRPQTRNDRGKAPQRLTVTARPLIIYPRPPPRNPLVRFPASIPIRGGNPAQPVAAQPQPIRTHTDGVVKRQAKSRASAASTLVKTSLEKNAIGPPSVPEPPVLNGPCETLRQIPGSYVG